MITVNTSAPKRHTLPLLVRTPDAWAAIALANPLQLLNDHAHLEKKAATNALDLLLVWPSADPPRGWTKMLSAIAKDEVGHLALVLRLLEKRGGAMTKSHRCQYAHDLRGLVRRGRGPEETVDRLMVSALIEARSAERFEILGRCCEDAELSKLYRGLWSSEHGHYRIFLGTALLAAQDSGESSNGKVQRKRLAAARWEELLALEARIIQDQPARGVLHGWV